MKRIMFTITTCLAAMTTLAGSLDKAVDRNNLDPSVSPGENFYQYACGGWLKANPLDPQYARYGTFDALAENSRKQVVEIIQGLGTGYAHGSIEQQVGDLYRMGMDSARIEADGIKPLQADLARIASARRSDFSRLIAWMQCGVASPFFDVNVMADLKDSNANLLYLSQGGLSMGDRDYYLDNDANTAAIRKAFKNYAEKIFKLIKYKNPSKAAAVVLDIETSLARVAMTREQTRDYSKLYNVYTTAQLASKYPAINWNEYFNGLGAKGVERVCVFQPASIAKVNELLAGRSESDIRTYLTFKYVDAAAPYLTEEFGTANFDMYSRAMSGKQVRQPRWKRALDVPNTLLGEAVGQLYVAKYFPEESKRKMQVLVENLKKALGDHIANLSWMSTKTKVNALVKLNSFTVKIGYPDKWRDYSNINIDPAQPYWTNVKETRIANANYEMAQLGKPVDKSRWFMSPQTVNAYYEPSSNEICFPAGILQAPYFDPNADDASNYGAIGVVIGHEMTHGFDDQGRNFDHAGNMVDWWTAEDAAKFNELAKRLGEQYSAEIVADGVHANGEFTMGENIADHGGLRVAYSALMNTQQGREGKLIDGFTPTQRFFLSYANVWANNITKEEMLRRTKVDPHSLGINRVNVAIRNLDAFHEAFNVQPGDKMYRAPQDRLAIW